MSVKYPQVLFSLSECDGNAYMVIGGVRKAMRRAGISNEEIAKAEPQQSVSSRWLAFGSSALLALVLVLGVFNVTAGADWHKSGQCGVAQLSHIPVRTESRPVLLPQRVVVFNETVKHKTLSSEYDFREIGVINRYLNFATISSFWSNSHFGKWFRFSILRLNLWWRKRSNNDVATYSHKEGRSITLIDSRPWDIDYKWGFSRATGREIPAYGISWFNYDPRPLLLSQKIRLTKANISASSYGSPLSPRKESVKSSGNQNANLNPVYGFSVGVVLFVSGFFLLGYSAKCFDELHLKGRGFFWLFLGGSLYVFGGYWMLFNPYHWGRVWAYFSAFVCAV